MADTTTATNKLMIRIYANLVINGRRTLASLPESYIAPVTLYMQQQDKDEA